MANEEDHDCTCSVCIARTKGRLSMKEDILKALTDHYGMAVVTSIDNVRLVIEDVK